MSKECIKMVSKFENVIASIEDLHNYSQSSKYISSDTLSSVSAIKSASDLLKSDIVNMRKYADLDETNFPVLS